MLSFLCHIIYFLVASHGSMSWSDLSTPPILALYCSMQSGFVQCLNRSATNWNRCTSCTVNGTQHVHIFLISEFYCKHLFASHRWRLSKRLLFLYELFWLAFSVWPTESYHVWRQQHPKYTDDAGCSNVVAGKCELPPGIFNKLFFVPDHISSVLAAFYLIRFAAIHELFWIAFSVWPNRTTSRCFVHEQSLEQVYIVHLSRNYQRTTCSLAQQRQRKVSDNLLGASKVGRHYRHIWWAWQGECVIFSNIHMKPVCVSSCSRTICKSLFQIWNASVEDTAWIWVYLSTVRDVLHAKMWLKHWQRRCHSDTDVA